MEGREVSSSFFAVLGVTPHSGRVFLDEEDRAGAQPVAVIGHGLWRRQFGGDASALGQSIVFDGTSYTVVGITPPDFRWAGQADVILPIGQSVAPALKNRQAHPGIRVVARLRRGATVTRRGQSWRDRRQLADAFPASTRAVASSPIRFVRGWRRPVHAWLLLGAVTVCADWVVTWRVFCWLALCARTRAGIRTALGAARSRLVRNASLRARVGAGWRRLGVVIAIAGTRPFVAFWPSGLPRATRSNSLARAGVRLAVSVVASAVGLAPRCAYQPAQSNEASSRNDNVPRGARLHKGLSSPRSRGTGPASRGRHARTHAASSLSARPGRERDNFWSADGAIAGDARHPTDPRA